MQVVTHAEVATKRERIRRNIIQQTKDNLSIYTNINQQYREVTFDAAILTYSYPTKRECCQLFLDRSNFGVNKPESVAEFAKEEKAKNSSQTLFSSLMVVMSHNQHVPISSLVWKTVGL